MQHRLCAVDVAADPRRRSRQRSLDSHAIASYTHDSTPDYRCTITSRGAHLYIRTWSSRDRCCRCIVQECQVRFLQIYAQAKLFLISMQPPAKRRVCTLRLLRVHSSLNDVVAPVTHNSTTHPLYSRRPRARSRCVLQPPAKRVVVAARRRRLSLMMTSPSTCLRGLGGVGACKPGRRRPGLCPALFATACGLAI